MKILRRETNEATGTKKTLIEGKRGFFVKWEYEDGKTVFSSAQPSLIEAETLLAFESEKGAEQ